MSPDDAAALDRKVAALRRSYCATLPQQQVELACVWQALSEGIPGAEVHAALHALHGLAHRIFGTGGVYGLAEMSAEARSLELSCQRQLQASRCDPGELREGVRRLQAAIEATAELA